ncbi:MAG: DUF4115 domain-containing protein [Deltaproteobacteria bacterium]|nr:DUF4115 domain-containing protein [Deltaproteobacteria bacterium]
MIQYLGILVLVVLAVGITYFYIKKSPPPPAPSAALQTPAPPVRVEPKREPPPPPITQKSAELGEKKHVLKVMAKEITWIRLELDDQPAFDVLLKPGETVNWSARQQFKLKLGNAGGVEAFLNGMPLGPLGASGQVVQISLPQDMKPPAEKEKKEP